MIDTVKLFLGATFVVFILPTWVRMIIHWHQRRVGTWNPENFHKWVWLPWRVILQKQWIEFIQERKSDNSDAGNKATGGWGGLAGRYVAMFKPGDVLLGGLGYYSFRLFQPLGVRGERHLAMVAGTGTGKTTFLITMLGLHLGNVFAIDPKAQIVKVIARRRGQGTDSVEGMGKDVHILDPNGIAKGHETSHWNALDELAVVEKRHGRKAIGRFVRKIAAALVLHVKGEKPYFPKSARAIIRGIILYVYAFEPPEKRNMLRVRELLAQGFMKEMQQEGSSPEEAAALGFDALLVKMTQIEDEDFGNAIRNGAKTILDSGRSKGDVLSTAREAMDFFDLNEIAEISTRSDFSLLDMKIGNTDVFVCAPTGDIRETYAGWFRLLTSMAIDIFEQNEHAMEHKTLFAIDEMPSIGYIQPIAESAAVMRSYGVQLLAITVDLGLLKRTYPDEWGTFLGGADAVYWMATKHQETLDYLSKDLGDATIVTKDRPWYKAWMIWRRWYKSTHTQPVMTPEQIAKVLAPHKENMITTRYGKRPLLVKTMPYFKELPVKFYEPDLDHREAWARAATRRRLAENAESTPAPVTSKPKPQPKPTSLKPKRVSKPVNEPVIARRKEGSSIELTFANAMAMFGITDVYTLAEIKQRKTMLISRAPNNHANRIMVEAAYFQLEKALLETEAVLP